jgi:hypothetical protein
VGRRGHRTDLLPSWQAGTRLILRRERPHPGAQLRITDVDGHRIVGVLTNTPTGELLDLELRTAVTPASRTASATPKTPGCATCPPTT